MLFVALEAAVSMVVVATAVTRCGFEPTEDGSTGTVIAGRVITVTVQQRDGF